MAAKVDKAAADWMEEKFDGKSDCFNDNMGGWLFFGSLPRVVGMYFGPGSAGGAIFPDYNSLPLVATEVTAGPSLVGANFARNWGSGFASMGELQPYL